MIYKVTEVVGVSYLRSVGSGNKFQKQKKGPWSFEKRKVMVACLGEEKVGTGEGGEPEFAVMLPWLLTLDMKMKGFKINTINRETDFSEPVNLPSGGAVLPPLQPQPPSLVIALPIEFLEAVNTAP